MGVDTERRAAAHICRPDVSLLNENFESQIGQVFLLSLKKVDGKLVELRSRSTGLWNDPASAVRL